MTMTARRAVCAAILVLPAGIGRAGPRWEILATQAWSRRIERVKGRQLILL